MKLFHAFFQTFIETHFLSGGVHVKIINIVLSSLLKCIELRISHYTFHSVYRWIENVYFFKEMKHFLDYTLDFILTPNKLTSLGLSIIHFFVENPLSKLEVVFVGHILWFASEFFPRKVFPSAPIVPEMIRKWKVDVFLWYRSVT